MTWTMHHRDCLQVDAHAAGQGVDHVITGPRLMKRAHTQGAAFVAKNCPEAGARLSGAGAISAITAAERV